MLRLLCVCYTLYSVATINVWWLPLIYFLFGVLDTYETWEVIKKRYADWIVDDDTYIAILFAVNTILWLPLWVVALMMAFTENK